MIKTYYLVVNTLVADLQTLKDEAGAEFVKFWKHNVLSVAMNPLYNEAYIKLVADSNSTYIKTRVQQAIAAGWIKSWHLDNSTFRDRLWEYWATLPSEP